MFTSFKGKIEIKHGNHYFKTADWIKIRIKFDGLCKVKLNSDRIRWIIMILG